MTAALLEQPRVDLLREMIRSTSEEFARILNRGLYGANEVWLIAGRHRLAAVLLLDHDVIDCSVLEGDDQEIRLWEISEDLHPRR